MSDKKSWGSTVAGWFIERDEPPGTPIEIETPENEAGVTSD